MISKFCAICERTFTKRKFVLLNQKFIIGECITTFQSILRIKSDEMCMLCEECVDYFRTNFNLEEAKLSKECLYLVDEVQYIPEGTMVYIDEEKKMRLVSAYKDGDNELINSNIICPECHEVFNDFHCLNYHILKHRKDAVQGKLLPLFFI